MSKCVCVCLCVHMCVCVCACVYLAQGLEEDHRSGDKRTNYSEIYEGKFIIRRISFIFNNLTLKSIKWKQTNVSKKRGIISTSQSAFHCYNKISKVG